MLCQRCLPAAGEVKPEEIVCVSNRFHINVYAKEKGGKGCLDGVTKISQVTKKNLAIPTPTRKFQSRD